MKTVASHKRYKITIPYRGAPHSVVVSVSDAQPGLLTVQLPSGKIITIERAELALLERCGMAERIP